MSYHRTVSQILSGLIIGCCLLNSGAISAQETEPNYNHIIATSPLSLFGKWRYEHLPTGNKSYGARVELFGYGAFAMLPYGRKYFADQAGDGYYVEAAAGPIIYFEEFFDQNLWAQMRLGVGSQWYTGKKNRPVDFNLSMNYDSMFISGSQAQGLDAVETGLIGIIGPWSLVKFRLQFGFGK